MSRNEIGLREARQQLGDLVTAAQFGHTTVITRNGRPAAMLVPYAPEELAMPILYWSVVTGTSPDSEAVEPGAYDIDIPDEVLDWASSHGLDADDPDVYMLVSDTGGEVQGEIHYTKTNATAEQAAQVRAAIEQRAEERAQRD